MTGSPATVTAPEWFLARDGEQFGPLSDAELRKLVEFGHLKPTDLLWREGFPEWRSARILLNETAPSQQPAPNAPAAVQANQAAPTSAPASPVVTDTVHAAPTPQPVSPTPAPQTGPSPAPAAAHPVPANAHQSTGVAPGTVHNHAPAQPQPQRQAQPHPSHPTQNGQQAYANRAMAPAPQAQAPYASPAAQRTPAATTNPTPNPSHPSHPAGLPQQARPVDLGRPAPAAPVAKKQKRPTAAPVARPDDDEDYTDAPEGSSVVRWLKRIGVLLFFTATLGAAAWYLYPQRDSIMSTLKLSSLMGMVSGGSHPLTGYKPSPTDTDKALQSNELWRVLKREFPEWYGERVKEAASLSAAGKSDADIGRQMMQSIVALRRKHAGDALSATVPRLKTLAVAFADNLTLLRQVSVDACHTFISSGETAPEYLRLLSNSSHSRTLQAQLVAVFEAIADGRKIPRVYPQPKQADYNMLVTALEARGWTDADMTLFSDSRRFGAAPPAQVCKMVTDWFKAQVELTDADAQLRLLADALKPVVAG
jgi:hypothetical protein